MSMVDDLKEVPDSSGVYCFYDIYGEPIYVGETSNLRDRLRQHLANQNSSVVTYGKLDPLDVWKAEYWCTDRESKAENQLKKEFEPKINTEKPERAKNVVDPESPKATFHVIEKEEAESRKEPHRRAKQKLSHLDAVVKKLDMGDHDEKTERKVYLHLEELRKAFNEITDYEFE